MMRTAIVFYGLMGAIGLSLIIWRPEDRHLFQPAALPRSDWPLWLGMTLLLALSVHLLTRIGLRYSNCLRKIATDVLDGFRGLNASKLWALAVLSGLSEEVFFRGWLLNEVDLVASSLIFGAVHIPPAKHWLIWPVFAVILGFALGGLCIASGTLVFAVLAHAGINGANLSLIANRRQRAAVDRHAGP